MIEERTTLLLPSHLAQNRLDHAPFIVPNPNEPDSETTIEPAMNLNTVQPLSELLPKFESRRSSIFSIHLPDIRTPKINIVVVRFDEGVDPLKAGRALERGTLRTRQFGKMLELITQWELQLREGGKPRFFSTYQSDGVFRKIDQEVTSEYLDKLKHKVGSFYADELCQEPYTHEVAKQIIGRLLLKEEAVVSEAESIIFDHQRGQLRNIEIEHKEIKCQADQTFTQEDEVKSTEPVEKKQIDPTLLQSPENLVANSEKEVPLTEETVLAAVEELIKSDRPNKQTAEYFEKLWNIPF